MKNGQFIVNVTLGVFTFGIYWHFQSMKQIEAFNKKVKQREIEDYERITKKRIN